MPRNRMIKVDFWSDEKVGKLSGRAKLLFIGCWNFADDSGVCRANPLYLRNNIFPYNESISVLETSSLLQELVESGMVVTGTYSTETYLYIINFKKHQIINRPSSFRYINDENNNIFSDIHGVLSEYSMTKEKEKEKSIKKKKSKIKAAVVTEEDYILNYFNNKSGKNFKTVEANLKPIKQRLAEYSKDELTKMIDFKVQEWKDDPKMSKYLRPETIFNATKCASYIEESKENSSLANTDDDYEGVSYEYKK